MARPHPDKMSFLEHLEELRVRLVHCVVALCLGFGISWSFRLDIFHFLTRPLREAFPDVKFIFTSPSEALFLYMKMAFFVGIFVAAPYILWQIWAFIAPGLYPNEKGYVYPFSFLGSFGGEDMTFLPKVDEYFTFYSWFLLGLGLVFQTPIVVFVLSRIGLVTPGFLLRNFKYAVLAAFVIGAVITPTPDMVVQTFVALPMVGLYLLGVGVAFLFGRKREAPEEVSAGART
jgi:sec-independent protein translocase protein TatC